MKKMIFCLLIVALLSGCASLRTYEKYEYKALEYRLQSVGLEPENNKSPFVAGMLNILPGIGNAYLDQWGPFVGNLLLWPYSVVWGIPQAVKDAKVLNKKETLYFYQFGPGKNKLEELEKEKGVTLPQIKEIREKSKIEIEQTKIKKKEIKPETLKTTPENNLSW